MKRKVKKITNIIFDNFLLKIISLIVAILLWSYASAQLLRG